MHIYLKRYPYLLAAIGILLLVRFAILPVSPPGFYMDEGATKANVTSMLNNHTNARGQAWPLFSDNTGGGFTTPTYLYPLTAWSVLFGDHPLALRAFSQFVTIAAIAVMAAGIKYWLGGRLALISVIVGLALPWGWLQGSIAWDPALVPLLVASSFLSLTVLLFDARRQLRLASLFILPLSLLALAYNYPPCRVTAPLLYAGAYALLLYKHRISWKAITASCAGSAIVALPLLLFMTEPGALMRSKDLLVFQDVPFLIGLWDALRNLAGLLNPIFLFITGDPNLRHSTEQQGMLGIASILPIAALLFVAMRRRTALRWRSVLNHPKRLLLAVAVFGIIVSLLGSALTVEGQPHSLRATAAWPFFVVIITLGWSVILHQPRRWVTYLAALLFAIGTIHYVVDLGYHYPDRAASSFGVNKNH